MMYNDEEDVHNPSVKGNPQRCVVLLNKSTTTTTGPQFPFQRCIGLTAKATIDPCNSSTNVTTTNNTSSPTTTCTSSPPPPQSPAPPAF